MSRIRVALAILIAGVGVAAGVSTEAFGGGGGPKCDCYFPNSNSYGIFDLDNNCAKLNCWVETY